MEGDGWQLQMDKESQMDEEAWITEKLDSPGVCITSWTGELMTNPAEEKEIYTWIKKWSTVMKKQSAQKERERGGGGESEREGICQLQRT